MKKPLIGFLIAVAIAVASWYLASLHSALSAVILALVLGLITRAILDRTKTPSFNTKWASKYALEWAIVLLAFGIRPDQFLALGWKTAVSLIVLVGITTYLAYVLSKKGQNKGLLLVGFGTAICGSSAIAALAPTLQAKAKDIGVSMAVVNVLGIGGMVLFPILYQSFDLDVDFLSVWLGSSLQAVGHVAGAGDAIATEITPTALLVKMGRVALLLPAWIMLNALYKNKEKTKQPFSFPWYFKAFVAITVAMFFIPSDAAIIDMLQRTGKIILTLAMAGVGLKVSFGEVKASGSLWAYGLLFFALQLAIAGGLALWTTAT